MSTIVAISTGRTRSAIGIIRMSGEDALTIAAKVFSLSKNRDVTKITPNMMYLGTISDNVGVLDECMIVYFKAPRSYSGEDMIEFSCHGSLFILDSIVEVLIKNGAKMALPGEFTKRAFLNGKQSLSKAEAVMDIIDSKTRLQTALAIKSHKGVSDDYISEIADKLSLILARFFAYIDYPDDEIVDTDLSSIIENLTAINDEILALIKSYDLGQIIKDGINATIIGTPNVGKSSILNLLANDERSIVTDIAGTTRDVVEVSIKLSDIIFNLSDTAGVRDATDIIERIGIEKAYHSANNSDVIFCVIDSSRTLTNDDIALLEFLKDKNAIALINKSDLPTKTDIDIITNYIKNTVKISAKTSSGIDTLASLVKEMFLKGDILSTDKKIITNIRHKNALIAANEALTIAINAAKANEFLDAVVSEVEISIENLLYINGKNVTDATVSSIFANFCVGK
ncbi:MAG: tRNA uridine-5-carboxymethylaminomethyl(34) synthesis GTPase MnmE [Clostridia bacterium]